MKVPKYSLHKATGQARVRIDGKDNYLGLWDSPESKRRYREHIKKWRADQNAKATGLRPDLTVCQLVDLYIPFAESHYRKNGRVTSEVSCIESAVRVLKDTCGEINAGDFGPRMLKETRDAMICAGWKRKSINKQVGRIRRIFRWAAAEQLVEGNVYRDLETLHGLQKGRTEANESEPVLPVPSDHIKAIRKLVTLPVRGMIDLQLACGCRPGEATSMRAVDITMIGQVWEYRPNEHKTEHHERGRVVMLGPKAKAVVDQFLLTDLNAYLFSPRRAKGANSRARERYDCDSYRRAIRRACIKSEIAIWSPNQLRHNVLTQIRGQHGLEAAQVVAGHTTADVTQVYAERDLNLAREIMRKFG